MRLDKVIITSLGVGLVGLMGCCNTDKIKEEAIKDFIQVYKKRQEINKMESYAREFVHFTKTEEYQKRFGLKKFDYKEIKGTPIESLVKEFIDYEKSKSNFSNKERKIREETVKEYLKCSLEGMKNVESWLKFFKNIKISENNEYEAAKIITPQKGHNQE